MSRSRPDATADDAGASPSDRRLIGAIAEHYRATPLTLAEKAAFDARLRAKLRPTGPERRPPAPRWPVGALVGAALAAVLGAVLVSRLWTAADDDPRSAGAGRVGSGSVALVTALDAPEDLFLGRTAPARWPDDDASLPEEYAAIADLLLADPSGS
jgi:hypothetical protein